MKLKPGDLILVCGTKWYSKVISFVTRSEYTHVAIHLHSGILVESDWDGVIVSDISKYRNVDYDVFRHRTATKEQIDSMLISSLKKVGCGYDYLGVLGIAYSIFTGKENKLDDKKRLWCSELVADVCLENDIPLEVDGDTCKYYPGNIPLDINIMFICNKNEVTL